MGLRSLFSEPPYKAPMVERAGTVSLSWLSWFNAVSRLGAVLVADLPYDPPSLDAGATAAVNITVRGANPGDFVQASFVPGDASIALLAQVTAANTVTVTFWNAGGGPVDLAAGTLRVRVEAA